MKKEPVCTASPHARWRSRRSRESSARSRKSGAAHADDITGARSAFELGDWAGRLSSRSLPAGPGPHISPPALQPRLQRPNTQPLPESLWRLPRRPTAQTERCQGPLLPRQPEGPPSQAPPPPGDACFPRPACPLFTPRPLHSCRPLSLNTFPHPRPVIVTVLQALPDPCAGRGHGPVSRRAPFWCPQT